MNLHRARCHGQRRDRVERTLSEAGELLNGAAHHEVARNEIKLRRSAIDIAGQRYRVAGILHQTGGPETSRWLVGDPGAESSGGR